MLAAAISRTNSGPELVVYEKYKFEAWNNAHNHKGEDTASVNPITRSGSGICCFTGKPAGHVVSMEPILDAWGNRVESVAHSNP